ncbi:MAG: hypothetical protein AMXMBFR56_65650 [Polyangiaceae bacterium]
MFDTSTSHPETETTRPGRVPLAAFTTDALLSIRHDLHLTIEAQEAMEREGNVAPKLGHYWAELFAVVAELKSRGL